MGEWSNLTQREKSNIIRFAIKNGVSDINTIRDTFNVYISGNGGENEYKEGGSIHIKHPGRLTALKERTGKTEAELWATGNAHTRKMITFARNARKWHKHENGGSNWLPDFTYNPTAQSDNGRQLVQSVLQDEDIQRAVQQKALQRQAEIEAQRKAVSEIYNGMPNPGAGYIKSVGETALNNPAISEILQFTPVIGDAAQISQAKQSFDKGNYGEAALLGSLLLVPNYIEKGVKTGKVFLYDAFDRWFRKPKTGEKLSRYSAKLIPTENMFGTTDIGKNISKVTKSAYEDLLYRINKRVDNNTNDALRRINNGIENPTDNLLFYSGDLTPAYKEFGLSKGEHIEGLNLGDGRIILPRDKSGKLKDDVLDNVAHEVAHTVYDAIEQPFTLRTQINPYNKNITLSDYGATNSVASIIDDAFIFGDDFLRQHTRTIPLKEKLAEITGMRQNLSTINGGVIKEDLDNIVRNLSNDDIDYLMQHSSGYTRDWAVQKTHDADYYRKIKKALLVGSLATPVVISGTQTEHSTGGPLYPFSFQKNLYWKTPIVRY